MADGKVIVIGGGAAGVWAALAARRAGASVALVRQAPGASAVSSGCIDLAAVRDVNGRSLSPVASAEAIGRTNHNHPYAVLAESLSGLVGRASSFLSEIHRALGLMGAADRNLLLATPLGTLKETWLAQGSIGRGDLRSWSQDVVIGVVELANRTAFDARAVAAGLQSSGRKAQALPVDFPVHPFASLAELAAQLDEPAARDRFVVAVSEAAKKAGVQCVLLPSAGRTEPMALLDRLGMPAAEIMGTPPSVPGLRFERDLEVQLTVGEVEVVAGQVEEAICGGQRIERLRLNDGRELAADAFILTTGRFIGGGIRREGLFKETVFGLPVFVEGRDVADKWIGDLLDRNAAGAQSAMKAGVSVDASMRALDELRRPVLENVFAAGSVIGGYDPARDGSGLGVAALTSLVAADSAVEWAHEHGSDSHGTRSAVVSRFAEGARP